MTAREEQEAKAQLQMPNYLAASLPENADESSEVG